MKYRALLKRWWPLFFLFGVAGSAWAQQASGIPLPKVTFGVEKAQGVEDVSVTLELVALLTVLSLAPSIVIMMTAFTRIVIVLNFVKKHWVRTMRLLTRWSWA
jgi:flagellar biosynthesis protein FliP